MVFAASEEGLATDLATIDAWCARWRMQVNRAKCGILRVGCAGDGPQAIAGIPVVSSYTYLGVVVDGSLDLRTMVRSRRDAAARALQGMQTMLWRKAVPLSIRLPLLKMVLVPVATYGCELLGMSTARVKPLSNVVDQGVQMVLGCTKSYCRRVAYEELGIEPVPVRAAKARMRAVLKWGSLRTRIAEMVSTSPRQRKGTWAESTRRWVRRYAREAEVQEAVREKVLAVGTAVGARARRRDRSVAARQREAAGMHGVFPGLLLAVQHSSLAPGWHAMVRIRTGTFPFAPRLAASGHIESRFRSVCPLCEHEEVEDAVHLMLTCGRWDRERQWLLREAQITNPPLDIGTVGVLLGGGRDAARSPLHAPLVATATFLSAVIRRRAAMLRWMTT